MHAVFCNTALVTVMFPGGGRMSRFATKALATLLFICSRQYAAAWLLLYHITIAAL